jgi:hypothetical protein
MTVECPNLHCRQRLRWGQAHECVILRRPIGEIRTMIRNRLREDIIAQRTGASLEMIRRLKRTG